MTPTTITLIAAGAALVLAAVVAIIKAVSRKAPSPFHSNVPSSTSVAKVPQWLTAPQIKKGRVAAMYYRHTSNRRYVGTRKHFVDGKGRALPSGYYFGDDGLLYDTSDFLIDLMMWYIIFGNEWADDLIGMPFDEAEGFNQEELLRDVAVANEFIESASLETDDHVDPVEVEVEAAPEVVEVVAPEPTPEPELVTATVDAASEPDHVTSNPAASTYSPPPAPEPERTYGGSDSYDSGGNYDCGGDCGDCGD